MTKDHKKLTIIAVLIVGGICANHVIHRSGHVTSSSKQVTRYDPVKNVTFISKGGFTWCVAGNVTNGTGLKTNTP